jgi:hypothetical protein
MLPGSADDPKTASRGLGPVQDDTDLHTPIVPAPAAGTISQLADACDAGAATSVRPPAAAQRSGPEWQTASTRRRGRLEGGHR